MAANEYQVGGDHYKSMNIQPWDYMESFMTHEQFCGFLLGTTMKYLSRVNSDKEGKGGVQDIRKAHHCLTKLMEVWG